MNRNIKCLSAALLAIGLTAGFNPASAQTNGSNSPYSRYGLGLLSDGAQGFNKGMAGVGYAMRAGKDLNVKNPASYSALDSLNFIFDTGISLQNANLKQGGTKVNAHNTSLDYFSMGFRIAPRVGFSLGLMPYSTIGYDTTNEYVMPDNRDVTQTDNYKGDGGLHQVYIGAGWQVLPNFSIGANVGYLWGDMTHTVLSQFSQSTIASSRRQYTTDIRTYKVDFGVQYEYRLGRRNSLLFGLTYGLGHDIDSKSLLYNQKVESGSALGDTLVAHKAYALPQTLGAGVTWQWSNSLRVGFDYTFQKWTDVRSPVLSTLADGTYRYAAEKGQYDDMHRYALGVEYVGDPDALRWWRLVRYRFGVAYTTPYARIDGRKGPKDYLVSLGASLPIINRYNNRSLLNLAVQYEHVKPGMPGMITERYLRLCIGLSFNERWFQKWKVQ